MLYNDHQSSLNRHKLIEIIMESTLPKISGLHPVLKSSAARILWFGEVKKADRHLSTQSRNLAITNGGIFLFIKRSFPAGFKLSHFLPLFEITKLIINPDFLRIETPDDKLTIAHPNLIEIAITIYTELACLFKEPQIQASTQTLQDITTSTHDINSPSYIADRFLALSAPTLSIQLVDMLNEFYQTLSESSSSVTITPEMIASPLIIHLVNSIGLDKTLTTLNIKNISIGSFYPYLYKIISRNQKITSIVFERCSFGGFQKSNKMQNVFSEQVFAPVTGLTFSGCDMTAADMRFFYSDISSYKGSIKTILIQNCKFDENSLSLFFNCLFNSRCFHQLHNFWFIKCDLPQLLQVYIIQLMGCDWILSKKSFRTLAVQRVNMELDFILPKVNLFETGLKTLDFRGCNFEKPIVPLGIPTFQQISTLDLSYCSFTKDSLESLFKTIEMASSRPTTLILDRLRISPAALHEFYLCISGFNIPNLEGFSWTSNPVDVADFGFFAHFLMQQKSLRDISISNIIQEDSDVYINLINQIVKELPLERFVIRGHGPSSFSDHFNQVLESIAMKRTIRGLDISGHAIKDEGLEILKKIISSSIAEVSFDETFPAKKESLISTIELLLNSKVEFAEWPEEDIKHILLGVPIAQRAELNHQIQDLKKKFASRFEIKNRHEINDENRRRRSCSSISQMRKLKGIGLSDFGDRTSSTTSLMTNPNVNFSQLIDIIAYKEDDVNKLLSECTGVESLAPKDDVLVKSYNDLISMTSLSKL